MNARPGATFEVTAYNAPTGLVGTIGVHIEDGQGNTVLARTTTGIVESPVSDGVYTATLTAPTTSGQYIVIFDTGGADPLVVVEDLLVTLADPGFSFPEGSTPTVDELSALLRARTYSNGQQEGVFNSETRPTASQVADLISMAAGYVLGRTGADVPDDLLPAVRYATALRAAMLIEMSYWPEQANETGSLYDMLSSTFDTHLAGLIDSLADIGQGADHRIVSVPITSPSMAAYRDVYDIDLNEDLPL